MPLEAKDRAGRRRIDTMQFSAHNSRSIPVNFGWFKTQVFYQIDPYEISFSFIPLRPNYYLLASDAEKVEITILIYKCEKSLT